MNELLELAEEGVVRVSKLLTKFRLTETGDDIESTEQSLDLEGKDEGPDTLFDHLVGASLRTFLEDRSGCPVFTEGSDRPEKRILCNTFWWVDPIDGTRSFTIGEDFYSISVGYVKDGIPVLGAMFQPKKGKLFSALKGEGAYLKRVGSGERKRKIQVSNRNFDNAIAVLGTTGQPSTKEVYSRIAKETVGPVGSLTYKAGLIAEGLADFYIKPNARCNEWDCCAVEVILTEARRSINRSSGGRITDLFGSPLGYNKEDPRNRNGTVITNGMIHDEVIEFLDRNYDIPELLDQK